MRGRARKQRTAPASRRAHSVHRLRKPWAGKRTAPASRRAHSVHRLRKPWAGNGNAAPDAMCPGILPGATGRLSERLQGASPAQGRKNGARLNDLRGLALKPVESRTYFMASSTATATETVAPTMGLLPMPRNPIISTWAGTELEPANCASECMRPRVSVKP